MFHFRLKSDKKPNGTKISAVKHVEYIDREGSYSTDKQSSAVSHVEYINREKAFANRGDCLLTITYRNGLKMIQKIFSTPPTATKLWATDVIEKLNLLYLTSLSLLNSFATSLPNIYKTIIMPTRSTTK